MLEPQVRPDVNHGMRDEVPPEADFAYRSSEVGGAVRRVFESVCESIKNAREVVVGQLPDRRLKGPQSIETRCKSGFDFGEFSELGVALCE